MGSGFGKGSNGSGGLSGSASGCCTRRIRVRTGRSLLKPKPKGGLGGPRRDSRRGLGRGGALKR